MKNSRQFWDRLWTYLFIADMILFMSFLCTRAIYHIPWYIVTAPIWIPVGLLLLSFIIFVCVIDKASRGEDRSKL